MSVYDLEMLSFPELTGKGLKIATAVLENPLLQGLLAHRLLRDAGIIKFRSLIFDNDPSFTPIQGFEVISQDPENDSPEKDSSDKGSPDKYLNGQLAEVVKVLNTGSPRPRSGVMAYADAYTKGETDPVQVATRIVKAVEKNNADPKSMNLFIAMDRDDLMSQAQASKERIDRKEPLGIFDGVPVAVKDEFDQVPYPTTVGTSFLGKKPALVDAAVVERLRSQGALLIGKANMHEIGLNPNGLNVHFGAVRNPFNLDHDSGGSSSGPAAAVASGLVPVAIGSDGGGSIRVPAGYCGVIGIKPTYGRISEFGAAPLCWSVGHAGPIAASVADLVLAYTVMAGKDSRDKLSLHQPMVTVKDWDNLDLTGVRVGVFKRWNQHSDSQCRSCCDLMVENFKRAGALVEEIEIPELDAMRVAHSILILSEMAAAMSDHRQDLKKMGAGVRINLSLARLFTVTDYVNAQRMRTRAIKIFTDVFKTVDTIVSPGSAITVPKIPEGFETAGWSALSNELGSMRYVFPANLTGFPAITFPGGYDNNGLPLGVHAMASPWQEALLFRLANSAEAVVEQRQGIRLGPNFS